MTKRELSGRLEQTGRVMCDEVVGQLDTQLAASKKQVPLNSRSPGREAVMYCAVSYCAVSYCVVSRCAVLWCVVLCCIVPCCVVELCCRTVSRCAVLCCSALCCFILLFHTAVSHCAVVLLFHTAVSYCCFALCRPITRLLLLQLDHWMEKLHVIAQARTQPQLHNPVRLWKV